jgi:hypothetical protein
VRLFVTSFAIGVVTVVVWLNYGWTLGLAFLIWTVGIYLAGLYEGSFVRWARGGQE